MGRRVRQLRVAVRWRVQPWPKRLTDAETAVLRRHLAELMREFLLLVEPEPQAK